MLGSTLTASPISLSSVSGLGRAFGLALGIMERGVLMTGRGRGFALHEALWRLVVGVSDPHVVQFPLLGGGEAVAQGLVVFRNFARNSLEGASNCEC